MLAELAIWDIPVWQYELSALRKRQEEEFLPHVCPIFETRYPTDKKLSHFVLKLRMMNYDCDVWLKFCRSAEQFTVIVPPDNIYVREKQIMPTLKHHRTIFIWLANSSVSSAIRILDDSVLWCEQAWIDIPSDPHTLKHYQTVNINFSEKRAWTVPYGKQDFFLIPKPCCNTRVVRAQPC